MHLRVKSRRPRTGCRQMLCTLKYTFLSTSVEPQSCGKIAKPEPTPKAHSGGLIDVLPPQVHQVPRCLSLLQPCHRPLHLTVLRASDESRASHKHTGTLPLIYGPESFSQQSCIDPSTTPTSSSQAHNLPLLNWVKPISSWYPEGYLLPASLSL